MAHRARPVAASQTWLVVKSATATDRPSGLKQTDDISGGLGTDQSMDPDGTPQTRTDPDPMVATRSPCGLTAASAIRPVFARATTSAPVRDDRTQASVSP